MSGNAGRWRLLAGIVLCSACDRPVPPPEWHEETGYRWRELRVVGDEAGFARMSARRTGIRFSNELDSGLARERDHLLVGSGVALGDIDGDGLVDVYLARLEGDNAMYRNLGDFRFEDVTAVAGVGAPDRFSTGASFADADGDGDLDLFVTALGGPNTLFMNEGAGVFSDATGEAGLQSDLGSTSMAWADVDGDGDLDLYVANYKVVSAADELRPYERQTAIVDQVGDSVFIRPEFATHFRLEDSPDGPTPVEQADPDRLYLNDGAGRFTPVSWTGGAFLDRDGRPLERDLDDFGLAARFFDIDGDADPDLYVANDFEDPDELWINDGAGRFRAAATQVLRTTSNASMSVDFTDVDRDGLVDFFVADMLSRDPERRLRQRALHPTRMKRAGDTSDRPQFQRNTLFRNRGDGTFAQIAEYAGVDASEWTWGSMFLDVDLDGFEDLIVANGHGRDMQDGDALQQISDMQGRVTWLEAKAFYPPLETRNVAFRNRGDLTFEEVSERWGVGVEPDVSHGLASGDLDGDGDLDLVVNRLRREALVLRNDTGAGRIMIRLRGRAPNSGAVGAKVRVSADGLPAQSREVTAGGLYLSGSETAVTFAVPTDGSAQLEVVWPGGGVTRLPVEANRLYVIDQGSAGAGDPPDPEVAAPLFEDVSDLLDHRHDESEFDDFQRQRLAIYRSSRLGPGIAWSDVDEDGDADLLVGGARGSFPTLLRNDGARFTPVRLGAGPVDYDQTGLLVLPGGDGTLEILSGQSNLEAASPDAVLAAPAALGYRIRAGVAALPRVEGAPSSTGPIALADVDGDGDLDLFIGGRGLPGLFPLPADSRLFENAGGRFVPHVSTNAFARVGLVSGATFSDLDLDGDPDLLLAVEWGTPRVFENVEGAYRDATESWGLAALSGRWNGVATGDFDSDGRPDVVLTNWGRNVRLRPEPGRPLRIYHGDVDRNGSWDVFRAQSTAPGGEDRNLERFERLRGSIPALSGRIDGFSAYARAGLAEIMGTTSGFGLVEASTYEHVVLMNRGDRFEVSPLPVNAQLAPSMGVGVADFDGDGAEDVVLGHGFFPTEPFSPRYDAGVGLLLLGDGAGGFEAQSPLESGIRVFGDSRGLAISDFDGDGRSDVSITQNGESTRLYRNVGARPGLRVRLVGPETNPSAIGASVRVVYADREGPTREIRAGSGYWSADDPVVAMGLDGTPIGVRVRWPGGEVTTHDIDPGDREVTIQAPGS